MEEVSMRGVKLQKVILIAVFACLFGIILGRHAGGSGNIQSLITGNSSESGLSIDGELNHLYSTISKEYDGKIDKDALRESIKAGLVDGLGDEYSVYMSPKEAEDFQNALDGDVGVGIGVEVGIRDKMPTVVRTIQGNPAREAGVLSGDIISKVNGEDVLKMTLDEVTSKIKGEPDTTVKIEVIRRSGSSIDKKEFSIIRKKINNPSVDVEYRDGVAIMRISRFDEDSGSLARRYAEEIKSKNISKMIVDLRGNGGGLVDSAQAIASLWIEKGKIIVTEKRGDEVIDDVRATGGNILGDIQTSVLVDESSASASEILTGALRDYGIAKIYGTKTYGKGSVQKVIPIFGESLLKITTSRWYMPKGENIDKKGISPDVEVAISEDDLKTAEDIQLNKVIEKIK